MEPGKNYKVCRVYPRFTLGGAEKIINYLLEGIPHTHMVVTHQEGLMAQKARELATSYSLLGKEKFRPLVEKSSDSNLTHLHTINNYLLTPLAVMMSDTQRIVQTVHNCFEPLYCHFVDHSILCVEEQMDHIYTSEQATCIAEGVQGADSLAPSLPVPASDRPPIILVDVRRKNKEMAFTLQEIAETGILDDLNFQVYGVGFEGPSSHPRVQNVGTTLEPQTYLQKADFLVTGSAYEASAIAIREAMAWGAIPVAPPLPSIGKALGEDSVYFFSGMDLYQSAIELRSLLERYMENPAPFKQTRLRNYELIKRHFSVDSMVDQYESIYDSVHEKPMAYRNFTPDDLAGADIETAGNFFDGIFENPTYDWTPDVRRLPPVLQGIGLWCRLNNGSLSPDSATRLLLLKEVHRICGSRQIVLTDMATTFQDVKEYEHAETFLEEAIALNPLNVVPHLELIHMLKTQKRMSEAHEKLIRAQETNPHSKVLQNHVTLAPFHQEQGSPLP